MRIGRTFGEIKMRITPLGYRRFSRTTSFDVIYEGDESNAASSLLLETGTVNPRSIGGLISLSLIE